MSKSWTPTPYPGTESVRPGLVSAGFGLRRILVCVDGSPRSEACVHFATALAQTFSSAVTILQVVEPAGRSRSGATDALGWELARQEASAFLEHLTHSAAQPSVPVETRVEQGRPAERIAATVRELGADLLVLGRDPDGPAPGSSLGGTAQHVLSLTRASVFIARADASPGGVGIKRILVPLDGSLRAESVLPTVVRMAKACGSEVVLAHVVVEPRVTAVLRAPEDLALAREVATRLETGARRYLDGLRDRLARELPTVRTVVWRRLDERNALIEIARAERSDVVILSAHGATCNPARPFGSYARHLLTHLTVPLFVLQDLPETPSSDAPETPKPRVAFTPEGA